ncbi:hypothetical protein OG381_45630 [Streptomyces sp. NBC_00490]|uniref:hypothetical protein n=1 Tax=Streptomyces sp. NBC_00490 TaxID=2903657 RepID=UPI002E182518
MRCTRRYWPGRAAASAGLGSSNSMLVVAAVGWVTEVTLAIRGADAISFWLSRWLA